MSRQTISNGERYLNVRTKINENFEELYDDKLSASEKTDLTDSGDSSLHYHSSDRNRSNHTGTQQANTISDFSSAVNTVVSANLSYITPEDFGALGDGSTDDTTAIQSALDSISSGGTIFFNDKTYMVTELTMYSNITLIGKSKYNSILKRMPTYTTDGLADYYRTACMLNCWVADDTTPFENVNIYNITVDGNLSNLTITDGPKLATITASNIGMKLVDKLEIRDCVLKNSINSGLWTHGCQNVLVENCDVNTNGITIYDAYGMSRNGLSFKGNWYKDTPTQGDQEEDQPYYRVSGCKIYSNHQEGIMYSFLTNLQIYNNEIYSNVDRAIEGDTSFPGGTESNITITDNYIHDNDAGVSANNAPDLQQYIFSNNTLTNNGRYGLNITSTSFTTDQSEVIISNNIINGTGQAVGVNKSTNHSIYLKANNIIVRDNICTNLELTGIVVQYANTLDIAGNIFEQTSADSLRGISISLGTNDVDKTSIINNTVRGFTDTAIWFNADSDTTITNLNVLHNYAENMAYCIKLEQYILVTTASINYNFGFGDSGGTPTAFVGMLQMERGSGLGIQITHLNFIGNTQVNNSNLMLNHRTESYITTLVMSSNSSPQSNDNITKYIGTDSKPTQTFMSPESIIYNSDPSRGENIGWVVLGVDGAQVWYEFGIIDLTDSTTYDPPSLLDGEGATKTVTVSGASLGDFAIASFSLSTQGITVTANVTATDTVTVRFQNETGGTIDLGSGTLKVKVIK